MKQLTIELTKEEQRNIFGGKATYKIVIIDGKIVYVLETNQYQRYINTRSDRFNVKLTLS